MRRCVEVAKTGLTAILLHPVRSGATCCALLAILVPYLVGMGVAKGIEHDAARSLEAGGDLYVSGSRLGQRIPLPVEMGPRLEVLEGVQTAMPRIVGRLSLGRDKVEVIVVGIPAEDFPAKVTCVEGRLPRNGALNEFVVGTELARRLNLQVGAMLPPFYRNPRGEHVSRIVGIFASDVSLWQSHLMFGTFDTAAEIFAAEGMATDFVVTCQPGYEVAVSRAIQNMNVEAAPGTGGNVRFRVTSREQLAVLLAGGQLHREGIFNLHFVLVFVIGILVVQVTSGLGLAERRREIGILKATGWQTDEILFRGLIECILLSVGSAALSILVAFVWLRWFNGYLIAGVFISGLARAPSIPVPFQLTPVPAFLAVTLGLVITLTGSLWSSWRAAIVPPGEAMR